MMQAGAWITCGNCGTRNAPTDQFCSRCGYSLTNMNATQTVVAGSSSHAAPTLPATVPAHRRITGALQSGELLGSRYRVVGLVGKGGFGAVYEATDERFQARRAVAIKELSDSQLSPAEKVTAIQDFRHEADLLVLLSHPNLPNVSDFFEEAGKAYLVMEFIQGRTLAKVQQDAASPLDEPRVMSWALQLCDVLNYLHTQPQPIIFRDMKPSNVMVTKSEQVKLIDFGIARLFKATATKDTTSLGSRGYAPLEQYGRGQTDHRSDIYALGATLYDMLTNSVPADAPSRRVNPALFETPRQLNPRISQVTETIILKAMAEDPPNRFQSAAEMYQAILKSGVVVQQPSLTSLPALSNVQPAPQGHNPPSYPASAGTVIPPSTQGPVLAAGSQPPTQPVSRRNLLIGGGAAALGIGSFFVIKQVAGSSFNHASPASAPAGAITVDFLYSTEKDQWLQAAIDKFHKSSAAQYQGKSIQIQSNSNGSLSLVDSILNGEIKPIAWSPASIIELNQLFAGWQTKYPGQHITDLNDAQPLVKSPVVFAVWHDRAQVLLNHYQHIDWTSLHDAMPRKWADIGGQASWQLVKFGQTLPSESNSGLLAIILMAYASTQKERGLTVDDINSPSFFQYLDTFESAVTAFGHSSGTYLTKDVFTTGTAGYDVIMTYENLVLTYENLVQRAGLPALRLFYPTINLVSNHPFAVLNAAWTTPEKIAAAKAFRSFLLAAPQQQLALQYGLRPANLNVNITDPIPSSNLFLTSSVKGDIQRDLQFVQYPDTPVVKALLDLWQVHYKNRQLANG